MSEETKKKRRRRKKVVTKLPKVESLPLSYAMEVINYFHTNYLRSQGITWLDPPAASSSRFTVVTNSDANGNGESVV